MVKQLNILFTLALCCSCVGANRPSDRLTRNLVEEFPYTHQISLAADSRIAFSPVSHLLRTKRHPALAQLRPGELSFYVETPAKSMLRFSTQFLNDGKAAPPQASVTLESDFPNIVQEYAVMIGREEKIDLGSFEKSITRIRFSAKPTHSDDLGGTLLWLNPSIEFTNTQKQPEPRQWDAFRKRQKGRNVLLFILDAASAAHFSSYGYFRKTTPTIDSLAAQGILFENAICPIPSTRPSTASLFSGLYPEVHGIMTMTKTFPDQMQTLPQLFQSEGYTTALFSGNPGGSMGYRTGFRLVESGPRSRKARFAGSPVSDANKLTPLITDWLTDVQSTPFFGYIHFREPHGPYKPPRQFLRRFVQQEMTYQDRVAAHYDGNLAFVDSQVGLIVAHLRKLNLWDRTIVIVMADHGEAFWQHGERGHIRQVYDEMIRIPLILRFPNERDLRGIRKSALVGTVDIMPTLIDVFSFTRKNVLSLNGRSLLDSFGSTEPERLLLSVCFGPKPAYSLRSRYFKYIEYEDSKFPEEFYDLEKDPRETINLATQLPVLTGFYRAELQKKLTDLRRLASDIKGLKSPTLTLDEQTREELRALGYVY